MEVSFAGAAQSALISVKMRERWAVTVRDSRRAGAPENHSQSRTQRCRLAAPAISGAGRRFLETLFTPGSPDWPSGDPLPNQRHHFEMVLVAAVLGQSD